MRYNDHNDAGSGRSRARVNSSRSGQNSRRSSTRSSVSRSGSGRSSSARSSVSRTGSGRRSYSQSGRNSSGSYRRGSGRRGGGNGFAKVAIGGIVLILAITAIVFLVKGMKNGVNRETPTETTTAAVTELQQNVHVDGIDISGMSREDAKNMILENFPWAMKVTWEDKTIEIPDLMAGKVDALLDEIYSGEAKENYSLDTTGLEEAVRSEAANVAAKWDKKAKNGSISSYDAGKDKFIFSGSETGTAVNQEKLVSDILAALGRKQFDAVIEASVNTVEPEFNEEAARERYEKIGSFTTKTTANAKRNTNIKLSAQALNGTVVQPGEEFSFNETVGERTEAKGYKGAAAYNNGEVVEEIGGGVCQTSSTLYNAVVKSGLKTTVRRSHTYEPSYVTPGTDATVSWGGPDYKFVNNSSAGIGIRAHYEDQTVTVSIYGIPVLEEGETYSLKSTKLKEMDPPAPTYEEDPTLEPDVEKVKSSGSKGSRWETRLVITKNGEVVSQEVDHNVTYKGHAPVILRNTSGTVAATQPGETTIDGMINPSQSSIAPEGAGDGLHQEGSNGGVTDGPGADTEIPVNGAARPGDPGVSATAASKPDRTEPSAGAVQKPGSTEPAVPSTTQGGVSAPGMPGTSEGGQVPGGVPGNGNEIQTIPPKPGA